MILGISLKFAQQKKPVFQLFGEKQPNQIIVKVHKSQV